MNNQVLDGVAISASVMMGTRHPFCSWLILTVEESQGIEFGQNQKLCLHLEIIYPKAGRKIKKRKETTVTIFVLIVTEKRQ